MNKSIYFANQFHEMHTKGNPLILVNAWDAGSAVTIANSGAKAIATSSWSQAKAMGYEDGEQLPFGFVLSNIKRIISQIDLPLTVDIEAGYASTYDILSENIQQLITLGIVGINVEDQIIGGDGLLKTKEQAKRIQVIREVASANDLPLFINARTDLFFKPGLKGNLDEAVERLDAYAAAGASGYFLPGLTNENVIKQLCSHSKIPINIMKTSESISNRRLAGLGVSRISYGPNPYCQLKQKLQEITQNARGV